MPWSDFKGDGKGVANGIELWIINWASSECSTRLCVRDDTSSISQFE